MTLSEHLDIIPAGQRSGFLIILKYITDLAEPLKIRGIHYNYYGSYKIIGIHTFVRYLAKVLNVEHQNLFLKGKYSMASVSLTLTVTG